MTTVLDDLINLLEIEPLEVNLFRGLSPDERVQKITENLLKRAIKEK